ncbi:MAG: hypothetical protein II705_02080 [Clostridia bacterium]|nr:hypothetical protein [Clostridia bacterium]MBQ4248808.1 hypothetical protein [Clostridia bacterium]
MNKKLLRSILCIVLALTLVFAFAACGQKQAAEDTAEEVTEEVAEELQEVEAGVDELDAAEVPFMDAVVTLSVDELSAPDTTIAYGDFEGMKALSSAIQNGEMDGKVVAIDGTIGQFSSGMSFSINESNEDGSESVGTTLLIQGAPESAYPADGTHVSVVGKVALDPTGMYYCINTLPECVQVVE